MELTGKTMGNSCFSEPIQESGDDAGVAVGQQGPQLGKGARLKVEEREDKLGPANTSVTVIATNHANLWRTTVAAPFAPPNFTQVSFLANTNFIQ